jgi:hypothetical protein
VPDFHVFCDESHIDSHVYRVQGGVWVDHAGMRVVRSELRALRVKHPKSKEFKWSEVHGKVPYRSYGDLITLFFDSPASQYLSFKCLIVRRSDDPSRALGKKEKDLGFYKAYHLLLRNRLETGSRYRIRLDRRSGPRQNAEQEVADCLNAACRFWIPPSEVLSCEGICSKSDDLMQLADVLCGAVAWDANGRKSASVAKTTLGEQIRSSLGRQVLSQATSSTAPKFNVWHYTPKTK